jgi:uncharacterized protein YneF (UPF0154 family)
MNEPKKIIVRRGEYYVYVWLDPTKTNKYTFGEHSFIHEPIYVGKGKGKRVYEWDKHHTFIKTKIKTTGKPLVLFVAERLPETKAMELEIFLIALIGKRVCGTGPLYNLSDGGDGSSGHINSEETKKRMSESAKKRPPISEETKRKISITKTGKKLSKEHVEKIAKANKGKKRTEEYKKRMSIKRKGEVRSEEAKKRMSESAKKRPPVSEETLKKRSKSLTGKRHSKETKNNISEIMKTSWSVGGLRRNQQLKQEEILLKRRNENEKTEP